MTDEQRGQYEHEVDEMLMSQLAANPVLDELTEGLANYVAYAEADMDRLAEIAKALDESVASGDDPSVPIRAKALYLHGTLKSLCGAAKKLLPRDRGGVR